ncbi:hypothetical protein UlMin_006605 [Ulmus minor]
MGYLKNSMPVCPTNGHCADWAKKYLEYCLCGVKDGVSLSLGLISVVSWTVAEIPQIFTNYKEKSAEGLSIAFLMTWIVGDFLNLFGCLLEPATLPTQYYTALLYTFTTGILFSQAIYYGHIYPRLRYRTQQRKDAESNLTEVDRKVRQSSGVIDRKQIHSADRVTIGRSSPVPLPALPNNSPGREVYYVRSARSLSRSHTPTAGSYLVERMTASARNPMTEPLLSPELSSRGSSPTNVKTMLSVVSALTFLSTLSLHSSVVNSELANPNPGIVIRVGRKLLQVRSGVLEENGTGESYAIGSFLGWGMAAIYMGGRLPQILLNIRKGNVDGLNPLMFIFALAGNTTYVASILVNSLDWSRLRPNLPWLVDAGGCVLLDSFIVAQYIYFRYWKHEAVQDIDGHTREV